jgi:hypothetical protein
MTKPTMNHLNKSILNVAHELHYLVTTQETYESHLPEYTYSEREARAASVHTRQDLLIAISLLGKIVEQNEKHGSSLFRVGNGMTVSIS